MSFLPSVRVKAMNACARHCCVCHRYKGVKIEMHHIDPKRLSGKDTFENAIPLCFDCHSDAGHYFASHPKGTQYSPAELKNARDNWYKFVRDNPIIDKIPISEHIQSSYYVLHSFDALEELILMNDFTTINKYRKITYLTNNEISELWKNLLLTHKNDYGLRCDQTLIIEFRQFETLEEYKQAYENVIVIDKTSGDHPYYEAKRKLTSDDLINKIKPNSFLKLLSSFVSSIEICCNSYLYKNGPTCGSEDSKAGYTEYLHIAPLSFVFLGITNASKEIIKLNYLLPERSNSESSLNRIQLPNFNILPYETILIPVSTNLNIRKLNYQGILLDHISGERSQDIIRIFGMLKEDQRDIIFIGSTLKVKSIVYNDNNVEYDIPIHKLDFNNLYSINRDWQIGSCPHIFFILENGKQQYSREILKNASSSEGIDKIVIPRGVGKIMVCELEDEVTNIIELIRNDLLILKNVNLCKGDKFLIDVNENDIIVIRGIYFPTHKVEPDLNDLWYRNDIVECFNRTNNFIH